MVYCSHHFLKSLLILPCIVIRVVLLVGNLHSVGAEVVSLILVKKNIICVLSSVILRDHKQDGNDEVRRL